MQPASLEFGGGCGGRVENAYAGGDESYGGGAGEKGV